MCVVVFIGKKMSYLVLARKYRPQNFNEVIGQNIIIKTLINAINKKRISNAYLFTGSQGIGKTTIARILAKSLSCQKGITTMPCNKCSQCLEITNSSSIDIFEIDGASNTSIDDIRILKENSRYQPSSARFKIFIIDEVHMLSINAFNALLKILEEPPNYVKFIFATTEVHKIPFTILSRCQRYDLKRITANQIEIQLQKILQKEDVKIKKEGLQIIVATAKGGMRDALNLLDQILCFVDKEASTQDIMQILGITSNQNIKKATNALINGNISIALNIIQKLFEKGASIFQFIEDITYEIRNLCLAAHLKSMIGLTELSSNEIEDLKKRVKLLNKEDLKRLFSMSVDDINQISISQNPRLTLELCFLKIADRPLLTNTTSISDAINRLEILSQNNLSNNYSKTIDVPAKKTFNDIKDILETNNIKKTTSVKIQNENDNNYSNIKHNWYLFVEKIIKKNIPLAQHWEHGSFVNNETIDNKKEILIVFSNELHFECANNTFAKSHFKELFKSHFKINISLKTKLIKQKDTLKIKNIRQIKIEKQKKAEELIRTDPLVKKALKIFGGKISLIKSDRS